MERGSAVCKLACGFASRLVRSHARGPAPAGTALAGRPPAGPIYVPARLKSSNLSEYARQASPSERGLIVTLPGILKKMRVVATALLSAAISFRANPISMYTILGLPHPDPESSVTVNLRHGNTHTVTLQQQLVESDGSVSLAGSSWETGFVLADYITNPATGMSWAGKTVVELGSGLGLCSIAAGLMGAASVCATDNSPTALRLLRDNLAA